MCLMSISSDSGGNPLQTRKFCSMRTKSSPFCSRMYLLARHCNRALLPSTASRRLLVSCRLWHPRIVHLPPANVFETLRKRGDLLFFKSFYYMIYIFHSIIFLLFNFIEESNHWTLHFFAIVG